MFVAPATTVRGLYILLSPFTAEDYQQYYDKFHFMNFYVAEQKKYFLRNLEGEFPISISINTRKNS